MSNISLFCIPYSDSSASIYYKWRMELIENITLVPLKLAGRGARIRQPLCRTMDDAIQDLYQQFNRHYDGGKYVLFGHSLGGLMAFELAHYILQQGHPMPMVIFFSGCRPPDHAHDKPILHTLTDADFMYEIAKLGGISGEVFRNKELMDLFTPIIKNDYRLYEQYIYQPKPQRFDCTLVLLHGDADSLVALEELPLWEKFTDRETKTIIFPQADHFFIDKNYKQVVNMVNQIITEMMKTK